MSSVDSTEGASTSGESGAAAPAQVLSRLCVFVIAGKPYAVDLAHIRGVVPVESITPIPGMPTVLIGVMNVHSSVVPVLDLRALLGLAPPQSPAPFAVVLRHEDYHMAVLVDRSPEIITALPEDFLPVPENETGAEAADAVLVGALKGNDYLTPILDVSRLVDYVESEEAARDVA